ncbi:MAG: peptidase M16 [Armatimonadota bacterium]|nr:MAG: peptidase M16 [Armatimonadota bacterium]
MAAKTIMPFTVPYSLHTIENGMRVVLSEDHSVPVVAVVVLYDVGARNEPPGRTGFAHLFEHMMFQGSANVQKGEFYTYVEDNGGVLNGMTSNDFTIYFEVMPSNQLELALWLEADRMRSLQVNQENLDNQREVVKEEKRLRVDNQPFSYARGILLYELAYDNFANAHSVIGSMEDLDAATLEDVQRFFRTYYAPNNAVLAIAGDFESEQALQWVRKHFGNIPPQEPPQPVDVSEPERAEQKRFTYTDKLANLPAIAMAWKVPPRHSPERYALALLDRILFAGESARLHQRLVKRQKSALGVSGGLEDRRGPGLFTAFVVFKPDQRFDRIEESIVAEITRIQEAGVTERELQRAKNQLRAERYRGVWGGLYGLQTPLGRAMELAYHTLFDGDPALINTELQRYMDVTAEEIQQVAQRFLQPGTATVLHILPGATGAEG